RRPTVLDAPARQRHRDADEPAFRRGHDDPAAFGRFQDPIDGVLERRLRWLDRMFAELRLQQAQDVTAVIRCCESDLYRHDPSAWQPTRTAAVEERSLDAGLAPMVTGNR